MQLDLPTASDGSTRSSIAIQALIDTGADVSCINQALAENLGIEPRSMAVTQITGAGGVTAATTLPELTAHIRNFTLQVQFLMLPLGATNMILGLDVLSALGATITCNPKRVEFNARANTCQSVKASGEQPPLFPS